MIFVIMLGMGASLTPRDFWLALKRPYGLMIGVVSQYGFMPFIGFLMAITLPAGADRHRPPDRGLHAGRDHVEHLHLFLQGQPRAVGPDDSDLDRLRRPADPARAADLCLGARPQIPRENIIATLVILLVPVAIGMGLRKLNANVGAVTEFMGSALALFFIAFIAISWVPRNWQFLLETTPATYFAAIMLGVFGITIGYTFARSCGCTRAMRARWRWKREFRTARWPSRSSR
jgi:BASS family bile acid:Na+ symporter